MPKELTVRSGPWRGGLNTSEPFNAPEDRLYVSTNGYFPDPQSGSGFFSRPGFVRPHSFSVDQMAQAVFSHTSTDGTRYNFVIAGGLLYRWSTDLVSAPVDVTPANISISATAPQVYAVSMKDALIISDGANPPWVASDLGGTPVTGTLIDYETPSVHLSIGSTPTSVATDAFSYIIAGTRYTKTAVVAGTALPAGTIPTDTWGVYRVTVNTSGTITVTAGAANYTTGYATEALAIAAVPSVANTLWNVGYFTVLTAVGNPFIANTSALEGGIGGNPSSDTNYYAGTSTPWRAYGQPVIYTGAVFFVLSDVDGVAARSSLAWSEPNFPNVGYRQTDYDNLWELTQTSSEPIHALAATNDVLYYSRAFSWGAIAGAPGVNFQGTATQDVVSGTVGCTASATVQVSLNFVYFCDALGRPYRFPVGGTPQPIWLQCRELFEDNVTDQAFTTVETLAWGRIDTNLNLYVCNSVSLTTGATPTVFDALTGLYTGQWSVGTAVNMKVGGIVRNASGTPTLAFMEGRGTGSTARLWRLSYLADNVWADNATPVSVTATTQWMAYAAGKQVRPVEVRVIAETGNGSSSPQTLGITAQNSNAASDVATATAPAGTVSTAPNLYYVTPYGPNGRGVRVRVTCSTTAQLKLYGIEADVVVSDVRAQDR
jgi:hypothetical protein